MDPVTYIRERQILWARRRDISLGGPYRNSTDLVQRERGKKSWVFELERNLYSPMRPTTRAAFEDADGGELFRDRPGEGNMYALHSSSAAAYNVFSQWEGSGDLSPLLRALRLPSTLPGTLTFETQFPIDANLFKRAPNLDVVISFEKGALRAAAIECKLCEPFGRTHTGLSKQYLSLPIWKQFPRLGLIARSISPTDDHFRHLHAAQLLKHILGLATCYGTAFRLLYCWYDVAGGAGAKHAAEVKAFTDAATDDGVSFSSLTYQELILRLAENDEVPRPYLNYLAERYL